ncbi:hypothetical protein [Aestuariirhabdus sp. LZHN29]|uniref:hypothetical protein n=1 Tax=Aestuariirhabdus sp. LZHN29 TaxID=3417462 RepID=UPI003CE95E5E
MRYSIALMLVGSGAALLVAMAQGNAQTQLMEAIYGSQGRINAFFQRFVLRGGFTHRDLLMVLALGQCAAGGLLLINRFTRVVLWVVLAGGGMRIAALPVMTVPMVELDVMTYTSPALLVRAVDIGVALVVVVLLCHQSEAPPAMEAGLLKAALVVPLVIGGLFYGMAKVNSFDMPAWWLLTVAGLLLWRHWLVSRIGAGTVLVVLLYSVFRHLVGMHPLYELASVLGLLPLMAAAGVLLVSSGR